MESLRDSIGSSLRELPGPELEQVLLEHAAERIGRSKLPREIRIVAALPRMENGKLARRRLSELYRRTGTS